MKRKIAPVFLIVVVSVFVLAAARDDEDHGHILQFNTMVGVAGPYVGPTNPIRDVPGGEMPWIIEEGNGHLKADGELKLCVRRLVLPDPPFNFTNPLPEFRVIVSCQSVDANNNPIIANVLTAPFPADAAGDAHVKTTVSLPQPCFGPIIFVVHPTSDPPRWFAATGN